MERLLELAEIRVRVRPYGVTSISLRPPDVVFTADRIERAEASLTIRADDEFKLKQVQELLRTHLARRKADAERTRARDYQMKSKMRLIA